MKHGVFAGCAVVGAALLAAAEFSPLYEVVVGTLEIVRRSVDGGDNHSYALLLIAGLAVAMALSALRGSRPAALALVALGAAALAVTLALDLPDARQTGHLPESVSFEEAKARPARGLYFAGAGGALLVVAGVGLLLPAEGPLPRPQLRVRRPRPRPARRAKAKAKEEEPS